MKLVSVGMLVGVVACVLGCSDSTELTGTPLGNALPDTRITGHPVPLEASFAVDLKWIGFDPDGDIAGYEWRVSDNGVDGISPRDTLTEDPLTGAVLHPWRYTTRTDTTLVLLADKPGFRGDDPANPRSFRSHSFFIRAVDENGAVDSTPALISFTSTTIVPTVRVNFPLLHNDIARNIPATVNLAWAGDDPDYEKGIPHKVRWLWKSAQYDTTSLGEPRFIRTNFEYSLHYHDLLDFDDPEWSPWQDFGETSDDRSVQFSRLPDGDYFLFGLQVMDVAGAVSVGMDYQVEVANVRVLADRFAPLVTLKEPNLGTAQFSEEYSEIDPGQKLNFYWTVTGEEYNGVITSCRHGWDLLDPNDPHDLGWVVPPGLSALNYYSKEISFQEGFHTFYLRVEDDALQVKIMKWGVAVRPAAAQE